MPSRTWQRPRQEIKESGKVWMLSTAPQERQHYFFPKKIPHKENYHHSGKKTWGRKFRQSSWPLTQKGSGVLSLGQEYWLLRDSVVWPKSHMDTENHLLPTYPFHTISQSYLLPASRNEESVFPSTAPGLRLPSTLLFSASAQKNRRHLCNIMGNNWSIIGIIATAWKTWNVLPKDPSVLRSLAVPMKTFSPKWLCCTATYTYTRLACLLLARRRPHRPALGWRDRHRDDVCVLSVFHSSLFQTEYSSQLLTPVFLKGLLKSCSWRWKIKNYVPGWKKRASANVKQAHERSHIFTARSTNESRRGIGQFSLSVHQLRTSTASRVLCGALGALLKLSTVHNLNFALRYSALKHDLRCHYQETGKSSAY